MPTPEDYENIRDNENKTWSCGLDRRGFSPPVSIRGNRMTINYRCYPNDDAFSGNYEITEALQIDLSDQPRLLSTIEAKLTEAIRGL